MIPLQAWSILNDSNNFEGKTSKSVSGKTTEGIRSKIQCLKIGNEHDLALDVIHSRQYLSPVNNIFLTSSRVLTREKTNIKK